MNRNISQTEMFVVGIFGAFLLVVCMCLSDVVFGQMGQRALPLLFIIIAVLVFLNMGFGGLIGKGIIGYLNIGKMILVALFVTNFSMLLNYGALLYSPQIIDFMYAMGQKYFDNEISILALFLIIQAIMANIVCFVVYNKPNYAILEYSEKQPKKPKKPPLFDKNNRQIKEGDTVEISDEDMQQIQNKFKWFAREMIADFEADLNKKIVIKKYIFEVTKGSDYTTTGLLLKKDNKTEVLYDDISKYCKIVSNNL